MQILFPRGATLKTTNSKNKPVSCSRPWFVFGTPIWLLQVDPAIVHEMKEKEKRNHKSILNASGTESSGKTKKIRLYKRLDLRSGPQNISKTCFYRAFFPLIFVWDREKAYRRSAHQELTFEWANYTHTHEARRTHDARRATESSSFRRSPRVAYPLDLARREYFARSFVSCRNQELLARRVYGTTRSL